MRAVPVLTARTNATSTRRARRGLEPAARTGAAHAGCCHAIATGLRPDRATSATIPTCRIIPAVATSGVRPGGAVRPASGSSTALATLRSGANGRSATAARASWATSTAARTATDRIGYAARAVAPHAAKLGASRTSTVSLRICAAGHGRGARAVIAFHNYGAGSVLDKGRIGRIVRADLDRQRCAPCRAIAACPGGHVGDLGIAAALATRTACGSRAARRGRPIAARANGDEAVDGAEIARNRKCRRALRDVALALAATYGRTEPAGRKRRSPHADQQRCQHPSAKPHSITEQPIVTVTRWTVEAPALT